MLNAETVTNGQRGRTFGFTGAYLNLIHAFEILKRYQLAFYTEEQRENHSTAMCIFYIVSRLQLSNGMNP